MQAIAIKHVCSAFIIVDGVYRTWYQGLTDSTWTIKVPRTHLTTLTSNGVKPRLTTTVYKLTGAGFTDTVCTTCMAYTVHTVVSLLT